MMCRTAIRGGLAMALLILVTISVAASPLEDLEESLRRHGVSPSRAAAIVSEADNASWEDISPDVDFAAVARSLTVESFADSLNPGDLADLAHDLSQEAETLQRLGFTRREVARALSLGVRDTQGAESLQSNIPSRAAAAAAGISRSGLRRNMQQISRRRGPPRGLIPPGVARRILDRPLPDSRSRRPDASNDPEETPGTPGVPGGR